MSAKSGRIYINVTKSYGLFGRSEDNRPVNIKKHRLLAESMKEYGWLPCFPLACFRDKSNNLIVKDGQHRLALAETLGLPVYWIEVDVDFDIAKVNGGQEKWTLRDYAEKYARNGVKPYAEGIEFSEQYGLTLGTAFALLAGTASFNNVQAAYVTGRFQIRDRKWANDVAFLYSRMTNISKVLAKKTFVEACMALARLESIDSARLVQNAERCREKLVSYSTREAFLEMLEEIYNFGRKNQVPLKFNAMEVMRQRNATVAAAAAKKSGA